MRRSISLFNKSLVLVELAKGKIVPGVFNTIAAANKVGFPVSAILTGDGLDAAAAEVAKIKGIVEVMKAENAALNNATSSTITPVLNKIIKSGNFSHIFAPSTSFSRDVLPRLAASFDVMPISDVMDIVDADTFQRGTYAGNAIMTVKSRDAVKIVTVRTASFDKAPSTDTGDATVITVAGTGEVTVSSDSVFVKNLVEETDKIDLTAAGVVVSGGRGLKNGDNFKLLYDLAKPLKGAVGATRAVVDAGYVPNEMQIGQTGKVVAPQLYIAAGLSGAIQHLAGMKDSKVIVAINTDAEAPIFSVADYGLVADLFEAVPKLTQLVSSP